MQTVHCCKIIATLFILFREWCWNMLLTIYIVNKYKDFGCWKNIQVCPHCLISSCIWWMQDPYLYYLVRFCYALAFARQAYKPKEYFLVSSKAINNKRTVFTCLSLASYLFESLLEQKNEPQYEHIYFSPPALSQSPVNGDNDQRSIPSILCLDVVTFYLTDSVSDTWVEFELLNQIHSSI